MVAPSFLAPERDAGTVPGGARPRPPHPEKADSWSLGVLLFTLMTGELPFVLATEVQAKHVGRIRTRVRQVRHTLKFYFMTSPQSTTPQQHYASTRKHASRPHVPPSSCTCVAFHELQ